MSLSLVGTTLFSRESILEFDCRVTKYDTCPRLFPYDDKGLVCKVYDKDERSLVAHPNSHGNRLLGQKADSTAPY